MSYITLGGLKMIKAKSFSAVFCDAYSVQRHTPQESVLQRLSAFSLRWVQSLQWMYDVCWPCSPPYVKIKTSQWLNSCNVIWKCVPDAVKTLTLFSVFHVLDKYKTTYLFLALLCLQPVFLPNKLHWLGTFRFAISLSLSKYEINLVWQRNTDVLHRVHPRTDHEDSEGK